MKVTRKRATEEKDEMSVQTGVVQVQPEVDVVADLEITKSRGWPHVSNDNPHSEAQFKTLTYRLEFPDRFGSIEQARAYCGDFFS